MILSLRPPRPVLALAGLKACVFIGLAITAAAPLAVSAKHTVLIVLGLLGVAIWAAMAVVVAWRFARTSRSPARPLATCPLHLESGVTR